MTVRIIKPEFNLREKLSELDRPVGLHGNLILKSETPQDTFDIVGTARKNLVINGGMTVSQRASSNELTPAHTDYGPDRMRFDLSQSSKLKVQQVTDAPAGFSHSMKVTSLSAYSSSSGDYFLLQNMIEGTDSARLKWGTSEAQTVTLSFYVKSSITGVHACGIRNNAYNRGITGTYEIKSPNVWERKTVTFPGCTDGTWETDIDAGLKINFDLGSGSTYEASSTGTWLATNDFITSDSVKIVGTNAATWYITGIQLETGRVATPFEHRSIAEELQLCHRYYIKFRGAVGGGGGYGSAGDGAIATLANWTNTGAYGPIFMGTTMRYAPTLTGYASVNYFSAGNTFAPSGSQMYLAGSARNRVEITIQSMSGMSQGNAGWLRIDATGGYMSFDADY